MSFQVVPGGSTSWLVSLGLADFGNTVSNQLEMMVWALSFVVTLPAPSTAST